MFWLILITIIFSLPTPTIAQTNSRFYQDFYYQFDLYNQAYSVFTQKKQIHQQYNSLATEKELIAQSQQTLLTRNDLIISYVNLVLNLLGASSQPSFITQTNHYQNNLQDHLTWLSQQPNLIHIISQPSDLNTYQDQFSQKYKQIKYHLDQAMIQIDINHLALNIDSISSYLHNLPLASNQINWISDIDSQLASSQQLLLQADQISQKQNQSSYQNYSDFYQEAKIPLDQSTQNLTQVINNIESYLKKFY